MFCPRRAPAIQLGIRFRKLINVRNDTRYWHSFCSGRPYQRVININVHDKGTFGVHRSIRSCCTDGTVQYETRFISAVQHDDYVKVVVEDLARQYYVAGMSEREVFRAGLHGRAP
jgi:hypothetical protein